MKIIETKILSVKVGDCFVRKDNPDSKIIFLEDGEFKEVIGGPDTFKSDIKVNVKRNNNKTQIDVLNLNVCEFLKNIKKYTFFRRSGKDKKIVCQMENFNEGLNILMTDMVNTLGNGNGDLVRGKSLWCYYSDIYADIKNGEVYANGNHAWWFEVNRDDN